MKEAAVDLGGLPVCFRSADARRAAAVARLLGEAPGHPEPARVVVRYLRRRPGLPARRPDVSYDDARVWHCGDDLVVQEPTGLRARVGPDHAWLGGEADDLDGGFQRLFHFAVTHILAHHDRFVLHGAGVVRDGVAYVALGPTGSGKSTLALAALSAGWQLLGDDMVAVRDAHTGLEVAGIPRRPAVPGDLGLTANGGRPLDDDHRARWGLPKGSLTGGWFPVAGVVFVGHGRTRTGALQPLAGEDALFRVLRAFSSSTDPRHLSRFFPVAGALTGLPLVELSHGNDASTRVRVARRLLERLESTS